MKPIFHPSLINKTNGDPALYIDFLFDSRAILFDLGDVSHLSVKKLLRVADIFISHTHMDHFYGFDHLLRIMLGRDKHIRVYGPPGIIANISGKLQGYTWNLVGNYKSNLTFEVIEIHPDHLQQNIFYCKERFQASQPISILPREEVLLDTLSFQIKSVYLDHGIPCLAFCLTEKNHINVNKVKLQEMGLPVGPWLKELKNAVRAEKSENLEIAIPIKEKEGEPERREPLSLLKSIVNITKGQKIAYVVDCVYNPENRQKILSLAQDADYFFCEAAFMEKDRDRAAQRHHLTACQAGILAREARAKKLIAFHFSPRYHGFYHLLVEEALQSYKKAN